MSDTPRILNATAYAVIDVNGIAPFNPTHDVHTRYYAYRLARVRNSVAIPSYPGARYKTIRVQIRAVK